MASIEALLTNAKHCRFYRILNLYKIHCIQFRFKIQNFCRCNQSRKLAQNFYVTLCAVSIPDCIITTFLSYYFVSLKNFFHLYLLIISFIFDLTSLQNFNFFFSTFNQMVLRYLCVFNNFCTMFLKFNYIANLFCYVNQI